MFCQRSLFVQILINTFFVQFQGTEKIIKNFLCSLKRVRVKIVLEWEKRA